MTPPVGLILCTEKGVAQAYYALEISPIKVVVVEYRIVLPGEKLIAGELEHSKSSYENVV